MEIKVRDNTIIIKNIIIDQFFEEKTRSIYIFSPECLKGRYMLGADYQLAPEDLKYLQDKIKYIK